MHVLVDVLRRQGIPAATPGRTAGELPSRTAPKPSGTHPYGRSSGHGWPLAPGELTTGRFHDVESRRRDNPYLPAPTTGPRRPGPPRLP